MSNKRATEIRYLIQLDTETGWTTVEATYYHTDAERWAKFYGDMVDDPQAARIIRKGK